MDGWWYGRHGDALAWVEAPSATHAMRRTPDPFDDVGSVADEAPQVPGFQGLVILLYE